VVGEICPDLHTPMALEVGSCWPISQRKPVLRHVEPFCSCSKVLFRCLTACSCRLDVYGQTTSGELAKDMLNEGGCRSQHYRSRTWIRGHRLYYWLLATRNTGPMLIDIHIAHNRDTRSDTLVITSQSPQTVPQLTVSYRSCQRYRSPRCSFRP
jgi:hypothetical protein